MSAPPLRTLGIDGRTLAYRELGEGPAVLLLHGWPTSSYLWRDVMPPLAAGHRVVALDLLGFGGSDKPTDERYGWRQHHDVIDGALAALDIDSVALAVHDLGGPIGVRWALDRQDRVRSLALLNTLLFPEFHASVFDFMRTLAAPETQEELTGPAGLEQVLRDGLADPSRATPELVAAVTAPFATAEARLALAKTGIELSLSGFKDIAARLGTLVMPVDIVYGADDRVLPDVADTMARVQRALPGARATVLEHCGHFLQEDAGAEVGALLAAAFTRRPR